MLKGLQMMLQRTRRFRSATVVVAVLGILIAPPIIYTLRERYKSNQRLVKLLCDTDLQVLLQACWDLSGRAAAGTLRPTVYSVRRHRAPEVTSFPQAIIDVDPLFVRIEADGRVWVALHPLPSQGVMAYPEDYEFHGNSPGNVELVPDLWFCDEMYRRDTHPEFVNYVNKLIARRNTHDSAAH